MIPMNPAVLWYTFIPQQKKKTDEDTNLYPVFQRGLFGALEGVAMSFVLMASRYAPIFSSRSLQHSAFSQDPHLPCSLLL